MESIMEINYSNDNRLLMILYSGHNGIYIMQEIDMNTDEIIKLYDNPIGTYKNVISMQKAQYNRDSSRIICCGNDGIFYELSRKGEILNIYLNQYVDDKAIYNPLLNRILCICQTAYLKEFDYITGKLINEIRGIHFDACYNSVGTNLFYTDVTNRCVYQMDTKTLKIIKSFQSEKDNFPKLISVNKDCTQIAIVYTNNTNGTDNLKSFDIEIGKELLYLMD